MLSFQNPEDAMRILSKGISLEARSATVFTLLQMDRVDLAVFVDEFAFFSVLSTFYTNWKLRLERN